MDKEHVVLELRKLRQDLSKFKDKYNVINCHISCIVTPIRNVERKILEEF